MQPDILNITNVIIFINFYCFWYFFIEILLQEKYPFRKQMENWNHISSKMIHYFSVWIIVFLGFYHISFQNIDNDTLRENINLWKHLVELFNPEEESKNWLIVIFLSIGNFYAYIFICLIFKYLLLFLLFLDKKSRKIPFKNIFIKVKEYLKTKRNK